MRLLMLIAPWVYVPTMLILALLLGTVVLFARAAREAYGSADAPRWMAPTVALLTWAADANTYISAACDAMCEEMDAQPADKIFDGPLWKALSSAGDIGIRGLLEHYGELQKESAE